MDKLLICLLVLVFVIGSVCGVFYLLNEKNAVEMAEYIDTFREQRVDPTWGASLDKYGNVYFTVDDAKDFKIMHLTDIHLSGGFLNRENDKKAINAVAAMVSAENPDLVIVTGDIAYAIGIHGTINNKYAHDMFIRLMENLGVYWTVAFGNHDTEPYNYYKRAQVAEWYADESLERCVFRHSPEGVDGEGNHLINIVNREGRVDVSLFMIDSHSYIRQGLIGGMIDSLAWNYDSIKESQVEWYAEMMELYNPTSSAMFFHIPLREVKRGYDEFISAGRQDTENVTWLDGRDGEEGDVVVYASEVEDNLFEKIEEIGKPCSMFFGHDHFNNFVMDFRGVLFSYGYSVDYIAYGDIGAKGYQRGCTLINLAAGDRTVDFVDIVHENYYQDKYTSLYPKESVDMYPYFDK